VPARGRAAMPSVWVRGGHMKRSRPESANTSRGRRRNRWRRPRNKCAFGKNFCAGPPRRDPSLPAHTRHWAQLDGLHPVTGRPERRFQRGVFCCRFSACGAGCGDDLPDPGVSPANHDGLHELGPKQGVCHSVVRGVQSVRDHFAPAGTRWRGQDCRLRTWSGRRSDPTDERARQPLRQARAALRPVFKNGAPRVPP
jgi:hypothetical protein